MFNVLNVNQRDYENIYIVGDIHGMFHLLEEELIKVNFNKDKDLLIAVGDLIDRGANSIKAIDYLKEKWFVSVFGNHDYRFMCIPSREHINLFPEVEVFECELTEEEIIEVENTFCSHLYAAIEIDLVDERKIAVIHAEVSINENWEDFKNNIKQGDYNSIKDLIWGRKIANLCKLREIINSCKNFDDEFVLFIKKYINDKELGLFFKGYNLDLKADFKEIIKKIESELMVKGVDCVIQGHNIISNKGDVLKFSNRFFIDTGAFLTEEFWYFSKYGKEKYIPSVDNKYKLSIVNIKDF